MMPVETAVMDLVGSHREEAKIVARYSPEQARLIEQIAKEYEEAVMRSTPKWVPITVVRERTGWSDRWLRDHCYELKASGKARKRPNGRWEIRYDAASSLPIKPGHEEVLKGQQKLVALAETHGAEA